MFGFRLPEDFLIGTANSAFQSEGAWDTDGKSESVMDHYAKLYAGKPAPSGPREEGYTTGKKKALFTEDLPDRGCFFYDHYEEYIEDMQKTGQNTYRLSLAWPRIIPDGVGEVNPKGIEFYNKVIDKLVSCGITPFVDLHHWDMPQCLMDKGGFANPEFPEWFEAYAKVCFEAFGDRVKLWSTFNESAVAITSGYANGRFPPFGFSNKEGQLAGHYCILAHFRAVRLYKSMNLGGKIGAVNCIVDITPAKMVEEDLGAAARQMERMFGWWTQPMLEGTYPQKLIRDIPYVRDNMPENYQADLDKWFIPMDFVGLNYYYTKRSDYQPDNVLKGRFAEDFYSQPGAKYNPYPAGLMDAVTYVWERYKLPIYITENGTYFEGDEPVGADGMIYDDDRIRYVAGFLEWLEKAIDEGYDVRGYYLWSLMDNFEWGAGYYYKFGIMSCDREGKTAWKKSAHFYSDFIKAHKS